MLGLEDKRLVIIGGCGHVGLPLGVKFALAGIKTTLIDIDAEAVRRVNSGFFPFLEQGGDQQLAQALKLGLVATSDPTSCALADVVVFVTGTPVDEHLNPKVSDVLKIFDSYAELFKEDALVIMRSTLYPGTLEHLHCRIRSLNQKVKLSFCPERVAQGYALDEIDALPQIVSAFDDSSFHAAKDVFALIAPEIIRLTPLEAEMTKLMANSWRYLEFAIANQFYMIAESNGVDFQRIYSAIRYQYPRANGYKSPGFSAGPCLFKDTMQLASFFDHQFSMGHSAMLVNEGLAGYVVEKTRKLVGDDSGLWGKTIGLLGMSFKADNDDIRESLSFRVKKGLEFKGAKVIFHDPFIESTPLIELLEQVDGLVLCTPHSAYKTMKFELPMIDIWGVFDKPELEMYPGKVSAAATDSGSNKRVNIG